MYDTTTIIIFIGILIDGVCAFFAGQIASKKGHEFTTYMLLGLFLPIIGIIVAAVLPDKNMQLAMTESAARANENSGADALVKYKMLLDEGAITQDEFDMMKRRVLEGGTAPVTIDEDNPLSIEVIHLRNGKVTVVAVEDGSRSQYPRSWENPSNRDKSLLTKEIAEEVEKETGRKVFYTMVVK